MPEAAAGAEERPGAAGAARRRRQERRSGKEGRNGTGAAGRDEAHRSLLPGVRVSPCSVCCMFVLCVCDGSALLPAPGRVRSPSPAEGALSARLSAPRSPLPPFISPHSLLYCAAIPSPTAVSQTSRRLVACTSL